MAIDDCQANCSTSQSYARAAATSRTCESAAMSWPGTRHLYICSSAGKRVKTSDADCGLLVETKAAEVNDKRKGTVRSFLALPHRGSTPAVTSHYKHRLISEVACGPGAGASLPVPAQRAFSAPERDVFSQLYEQFAPTTPPVLQQLAFASPPSSPPHGSMRMTRHPLTATTERASAGRSPVPDARLVSGLLSQAFSHIKQKSSAPTNSIPIYPSSLSLGRDCGCHDVQEALPPSPSTPPAAAAITSAFSVGCAVGSSLLRQGTPPTSLQLRQAAATATSTPTSSKPEAAAADDDDDESLMVTIDLYDNTPPPAPPSSVSYSSPPSQAAFVAWGASSVVNAAVAGVTAPAPWTVLPYDLSRSALWRVGPPRGRPPLPSNWRLPDFSLSPASSALTSDLHTPAEAAAAGQTPTAPAPSASFCMVRSRGGMASPFGPAPYEEGPAAAYGTAAASPGEWEEMLPPDGVSEQELLRKQEDGLAGSQVVCWGGAAWTRQCSPFAELAADGSSLPPWSDGTEGEEEEEEEEEEADAGSGTARPTSPSYPSSHPVQQLQGDGDSAATASASAAPVSAVETPAAGPTAPPGAPPGALPAAPPAAPMDDEELDEYYLHTLCGGVDPLAAFMERERGRQQQLEGEEVREQQQEQTQQEEEPLEAVEQSEGKSAAWTEGEEAVAAVARPGSLPLPLPPVSLLLPDTPAAAAVPPAPELGGCRTGNEAEEGAEEEVAQAEVAAAEDSPQLLLHSSIGGIVLHVGSPAGVAAYLEEGVAGCGEGADDAGAGGGMLLRDTAGARAAAPAEQPPPQPPSQPLQVPEAAVRGCYSCCCAFHAAELQHSAEQQHQQLQLLQEGTAALAASVPYPEEHLSPRGEQQQQQQRQAENQDQEPLPGCALSRAGSCAHCRVAGAVVRLLEAAVWENCFMVQGDGAGGEEGEEEGEEREEGEEDGSRWL